MPFVLISRLHNDAYLHRNTGTNTKPIHDNHYLTGDISQAEVFDDEVEANKEIRRLTGNGMISYYRVLFASYKFEPVEIFFVTADDLAANEMLKAQWDRFLMSKKLCT